MRVLNRGGKFFISEGSKLFNLDSLDGHIYYKRHKNEVDAGIKAYYAEKDKNGVNPPIKAPVKRMAGEDPLLEEAFAYLANQSQEDIDIAAANRINRGEVAQDVAIQDAQEYMHNLNFNKAMAKQAGIPKSLQDSEVGLLVDELSNNVPAPIIREDRSRNVQRRIHTKREANPVTGVEQVVPFINEATNTPLITEFGKNVDMEGQDKASEYVQDHILRLAGFNPTRGPEGKIDFYIEKDGQRIGIDGQTMATGDNPQVEAYTKAIPANRERGGYGKGYAKSRWNPDGINEQSNVSAIKNDMAGALSSEMGKGVPFRKAMDNLVADGKVRNDRNLEGKLYKDDYDMVLMPMQNRQAHKDNRKNDNIAIAPDNVIQYDLNEIRNHVNNISNPNDLKIAYNAAMNGRGEARTKIRAEVPQSAIQNVVEQYPYVAQILAGMG
tara:strand:- start:3071 stop:4384 length:1314 start_codon:yes stop_codon:yes gene_type:complete